MSSVVAEDLARRFALRFAGHVSVYGQYYDVVHGGVKNPQTIRGKPIPEDAWRKHLAGDGPYLGIVPIREDSTCYFGAIDVDDDGVDLAELDAQITQHDLPLVVCRSKSGGAHLYCFLKKPVPAQQLVEALKSFRKTLGRDRNAKDNRAVEIFPKQTKLKAGQTGNWINLPYWDHENTNRYAVLGEDHLRLEEFLDVADARAIDPVVLVTWADPALGPFADGPICLQKLHQLRVPEGGRNTAMLNIGTYFKIARSGDWEAALREYNRDTVSAPLPEAELSNTIRSLHNHNYPYTCNDEPLCRHCDKKACLKQPFGIGHFIKQAKLDRFPEITEFTKVLTVPPRYRFLANGVELECSLEEFASFARFRIVLLAGINKKVDPLTDREWSELQNNLLASMREEAAPMDSGDRGLLLTYLGTFLEKRHLSSGMDDVYLNRPATDGDGRVYFQAVAFQEFLRRHSFSRFSAEEMYSILKRDAGLTFTEKIIKGGKVRLWSVPIPTNEQTEPHEYPAARHEQTSY